MHIRGKIVIALSCSAHWVMVRLLGRARISLGLRCKKSEERRKEEDWEGELTERTRIWTAEMAERSERQSGLRGDG